MDTLRIDIAFHADTKPDREAAAYVLRAMAARIKAGETLPLDMMTACGKGRIGKARIIRDRR
jgi:hypothetical protein